MHGLDEAKIVNLLFQVRQAVGNPLPALSDLVKRVLRRQEFGNAADECETLARQEGCGTILAVESFQVRLVFEKFQLARRSGHVQIDDPPHFGSKLRRQRGKRAGWLAREVETDFGAASISRGSGILCQRCPHEQSPQTAAQSPQEMTACLRL